MSVLTLSWRADGKWIKTSAVVIWPCRSPIGTMWAEFASDKNTAIASERYRKVEIKHMQTPPNTPPFLFLPCEGWLFWAHDPDRMHPFSSGQTFLPSFTVGAKCPTVAQSVNTESGLVAPNIFIFVGIRLEIWKLKAADKDLGGA